LNRETIPRKKERKEERKKGRKEERYKQAVDVLTFLLVLQ
jgi:hypothetical protein